MDIKNLDISPLLNEVNEVVEKRVNMLLVDYSEKYNLYEETYNLIMNVANKNKSSKKEKVIVEDKENLHEKVLVKDEKHVVKCKVVKEKENLQEKVIVKEEKVVENNFNLSEIISCIKGTIQDEIKPVYKEIRDLHSMHEIQDNKITTLQGTLLEFNKKNKDNILDLKDELFKMKLELNSIKNKNLNEKCKENITLVINEEELEEELEEEIEEDLEEELEEEIEEELEEENEKVIIIDKQKENEPKEEEDEEEEELFEIEIDDITYYTNNEENGIIYEVTKDEEVGKKVGYLKDGEPYFN